jgi:hypothetical protein
MIMRNYKAFSEVINSYLAIKCQIIINSSFALFVIQILYNNWHLEI